MSKNSFLRTFSTVEPIGPAEAWDSGTTSGDGTGDAQLIDAAKSFESSIIPGMIAVNTTDGTYAVVTEVIDDNTLQLNKDGLDASKAYTIFYPASDVIKPLTGQELLLFRIWASAQRPVGDNGAGDGYVVMLTKEAFGENRVTEPIAITDYVTSGPTGSKVIDIKEVRSFPTQT